MSELSRNMSRADQQRLKPAPEDLIPYCLDGDKGMIELALDFVAHLRATNKARLCWFARNAWRIKLKGENLCELSTGFVGWWGDNDHKWWIVCNATHINEYENKIVSAGLQDFVLNNINQCRLCNPKGKCGNQRNITVLGSEFTFCGGVSIWVWDPDEKEVEGMKKLIELEKIVRSDIN